jgi:hypothetical protein
MDLRLQIHHRDPVGTWSITGLPGQSVAGFEDLSEGLEYARRQCASAPATIELFVDGLYLVVYQERGWSHQICRPAGYRLAGVGTTTKPVSASKFARICGRLRRNTDCRDISHFPPFYRRTRASRFIAGIASVFHASQTSKS